MTPEQRADKVREWLMNAVVKSLALELLPPGSKIIIPDEDQEP